METKLNSAYLYVLVLFVSASFKIWHSSLTKNTNTLKHWRNDKVNDRIRKVITILTRKEITYFVTCCRSRTEMSEVEELISSWISAKNDSLKRVTRGFMNSIRNGLPIKNEKKSFHINRQGARMCHKISLKRFSGQESNYHYDTQMLSIS